MIGLLRREFFRRGSRSRLVTRALFHLDPPALEPGERYFDSASVALVRSAATRVESGARVIDLGCGSFALLALALEQRAGRVLAIDVAPRITTRARTSVAHNRSGVEVREGDLLAGLDEPFDFVLFDPPYVPSAVGEAQGLPESHRTQWDGGPDGTAVAQRFLESFAVHGGEATALLGVNRHRVSRERMSALVASSGLEVADRDSHDLVAADVWVLRR